MRNRRTTDVPLVVRTPSANPIFPPGALVKEWARRRGWNLGVGNVMFEGTTDIQYLSVANDLYLRQYGKRLIGDGFHVFAVGERENGGTEAIREQLRTLSDVLRDDPNDCDGKRIRVICLMDDGPRGKGVFNQLGTRFRKWGDIFLLKRRFPMDTRDPGTFEKRCNAQNADWSGMDCDIEDLISKELLEEFVRETPNALSVQPVVRNGGHHFKLTPDAKPKLVRFVRDNAMLADVGLLVGLLHSLRWLLEFPADGSPIV